MRLQDCKIARVSGFDFRHQFFCRRPYLFACGRGAPHVMPCCTQLQRDMQLWNDEEMLNYVETRLGLMTSNIQDNRRERMASLIRCGMLFSCIYVGEEPTKDKTPNLGDSADTYCGMKMTGPSLSRKMRQFWIVVWLA